MPFLRFCTKNDAKNLDDAKNNRNFVHEKRNSHYPATL